MKVKFNLNLFYILLIGFSSGLPLALTASTLSVYLYQYEIDLKTIGMAALLGWPYIGKILWAPLVDSLKIPLFTRTLGQRRGWLIFTQIFLALSIATISCFNPADNLAATLTATFFIALFSATQDLAVDALRIESLKESDQAYGAAYYTFGYRIGMVISTFGALKLSSAYNWQFTYLVMGSLVAIGMIATLLMNEPNHPKSKVKKNLSEYFEHSFIKPFADFFSRENSIIILIFILLYKLSDAYIGMVTNPFLLKMGFTIDEIAEVVKLMGVAATLLGVYAGGFIAKNISLKSALFIGAMLQIITNGGYLIILQTGHDVNVLATVIAVDNFSGGIGTAALVAYLSVLCNREFTATQYALLSAFASTGRQIISSTSGITAENYGWQIFFIIAMSLSVPVLFLFKYVDTKKK